ncbi:MAG: PIN domain-containing protein [Candidatus Limnocylindrales bacterium]|nr:PIN domain-containing protein [Candidatus Limnocylindrales bacterium]
MIAVDTSVVVRYLVGTPDDQARRATTLMDGSTDIGIPIVALIETAHVLRTQYGVGRSDIIDVLISLLTRENISVLGLPTAATLEALVRARSIAGAPLLDALIAATARSSSALPLYTFDETMHLHGVAVATP